MRRTFLPPPTGAPVCAAIIAARPKLDRAAGELATTTAPEAVLRILRDVQCDVDRIALAVADLRRAHLLRRRAIGADHTPNR